MPEDDRLAQSDQCYTKIFCAKAPKLIEFGGGQTGVRLTISAKALMIMSIGKNFKLLGREGKLISSSTARSCQSALVIKSAFDFPGAISKTSGNIKMDRFDNLARVMTNAT